MWCRIRDEEDMTARTQTLRWDYKACIIEDDLCTSSKVRGRVEDYSLCNWASGGGGGSRREGRMSFITGCLRG